MMAGILLNNLITFDCPMQPQKDHRNKAPIDFRYRRLRTKL
jgi:hypothetical protein